MQELAGGPVTAHAARSAALSRAELFPVVIFTNSMVMGGMEEHVLQLGGGLRERGFPVAVICSSDDAIAPLRAGLTAAGVDVHALSGRRASLAGALPRVRELAGVMRRYRGALLHMHFTGHRGGDLALVAARLAGVRAIVRSVHLPPVERTGRVDQAILRISDSQLARIICVSSETRRAHLAALGRDARKCVVVHNGIDLRRFSPAVAPIDARAEFGFDRSSPIIGTVARLGEKRKGVDHFIEAAAIVAARLPEVRFVVAGDGDLRPELERLAADRGLGRRIVFTGHRTDVPSILASLAVFVSPSIYEACQYNLLEAMAAGRPVVSTLTGVAPEVITDGVTGRSVRIADPQGIADAIGDVLRDPERAAAMGTNARALMERSFSVEAMLDGIVAVYRSVSAAT